MLSVDEQHQSPLAERIMTESLSVRAAEDLARSFKSGAEGTVKGAHVINAWTPTLNDAPTLKWLPPTCAVPRMSIPEAMASGSSE